MMWFGGGGVWEVHGIAKVGRQREYETHSGDEQDVDRRDMQGEAVRAEEGHRSLVAKVESALLGSRYERMGRTARRIATTTGQRM